VCAILGYLLIPDRAINWIATHMTSASDPEDKYIRAASERQKHVEAVLRSPAKKKIVVAGPGTGKTHLFKKMVKGKPKTLTLSFINALVDDLSLELCGLSEVRTLHGFALSELRRLVEPDIEIFPGLSDVVREDSVFLRSENIDFDKLLHDDVVGNLHVDFYRERKDYYASVYGLASIVYALVQYYRRHREKMPVYDQIVVDEFQDFKTLEVALIDLLAERSPVLLAGDDDQALYDFKSASAKFIRRRHGALEPGYEPFTLPYCSRCRG
jgi:superfamily I DNA/RNA helicase